MEKSPQQTTITVDEKHHDKDVDHVTKWTPGYRERFPVLGAVCLVLTVVFAAGAFVILIVTNHMSSVSWSQNFAPNVALSLLNSLSMIFVGIAVSEGVTIAWWRKAMKGSTVARLHKEWSIANSFYWLLFTRQTIFSSITFAILATQIALVNSILYQRATSTYVAHDMPRSLHTVGIGATEFPMTGYVVSNTSIGAQTNCACFMVGDAFTPIVNTWETSNGFYPGYNEYFRFSNDGSTNNLQYCNGLCYATLDAIGFEIDCTNSTNHTDIAIPAIAAYNSNGSSSAYTNLPIFNSSFALEYATQSRNYSQIILNLQYFQSDDPYNPKSTSCPGTVFTKQCSLRPAIVRYPVAITNFTNVHVTNGVSLETQDMSMVETTRINAAARVPQYDATLKQASGYQVIDYLYPKDAHQIRSLTALGGVASAMSQFLSSTAAITYTGDSDWSLNQVGTLSQTMMYGPPNMGSCDCSFNSQALDIIISKINELGFLLATGMVDYSSFYGLPSPNHKKKFPSTLPSAVVIGVDQNDTASFRASSTSAMQISDIVYYRTHYIFAGLAFGITVLCVLLVIPSFWHYGELGRRVTLGPIEIASAFGAPVLTDDMHHETAEAPVENNIDTLIKNIGDRKIVYGFVDIDNEGHQHQEMHLQRSATMNGLGLKPMSPMSPFMSQSPHIPSPTVPQSPNEIASPPPPMSPIVDGDGTSRLSKRKSVRLAMGSPAAVRPTSVVMQKLATFKDETQP